ncbi:MAG TPA: efflux RND transporter periplasmic adaptor subunit [Terriglobales bacterium]|nr:efflux RND transporter periplasmic adaptor subunit [Terriglobales bacterium]
MNSIRMISNSRSRKAEDTSEHQKPATCALGRQILLVLSLFAVIILNSALVGCGSGNAAVKLPDTEVLVAPPVQQDVPVHSEWVATLDGYVNAEIHPQVSGYMIKQNYTEGSVVRRGQVLFEIDPRPFQATLDRSKGELAQAEAQLSKSTIDVERDTPLVAEKAVPKEKLDNEIQAKRAAEAAVESAKAAVERAELDLGWTKVTSLVDGIAGICEVQMGNLIGPGSRLTSVSQVDPIKVYFPVSEQEYLRAKHVSTTGQPMDLFDSSPELILADGTVYPHKGRILLTDRQVDTNTGTIRLVAAFPNPGNILRPGQYGRVRIQTSFKKGALLVPQSAVKELQGGYQIALLGPNNKAMIRPVKAGEKVGTMWVIDDGLKPGEQVVVEGVEKVKDGTAVVPKAAKAQAEAR